MAAQNHNNRESKGQLNKYARFSGMAFEMIAIIGVGTYFGIKLDQKFPNEYNLYSVALSFTSVIIALIFIIRRIIAASKKDKS